MASLFENPHCCYGKCNIS